MSLINQMLTDLEARRGGTLRSVDHALDGLQSAPIAPRPHPRPSRRRWVLAGGVVAVAVLAGLVAWWWQRGKAEMPPALPTIAPPAASAGTTAAASASVAPAAPVILADKPVPPVAIPPLPVPAPVQAQVPVVTPPPAAAPAAPVPAAVVAPPPAPTPVPAASAPAATTVPPLPTATATAPATPAVSQPAPAEAAKPVAPEVETPGAFHRSQANPQVDPDAVAYQQALREADDGALAGLESFVASHPRRSDARQRLALAQIKASDNKAAEATLRAGLALRPGDAGFARLLGHVLLGTDQVDAALEVLRTTPPPLAKDPEFHALLAAAEQRSGAHAMAATRYKNLLQIEPTNGSWIVGLAISLAALGDSRTAARLFNQALDDRNLPEPLRAYASRERLRIEEHLK